MLVNLFFQVVGVIFNPFCLSVVGSGAGQALLVGSVVSQMDSTLVVMFIH